MSTTLGDVMHEILIEQQLDLDRQAVESHVDQVMFDLHYANLFKWSGDDVKSYHQAKDNTLYERDHFYRNGRLSQMKIVPSSSSALVIVDASASSSVCSMLSV